MKRKLFRSIALMLAVAIATGALFSSILIMKSVERGSKTAVSMLGADILVAPTGYEAAARSSLLAGEPQTFYMDRSIEEKIAQIDGVEKTSPQIYAETSSYPCCGFRKSFLVGFDPKTDFTVMPWLNKRLDRPMGRDDVVIGSEIPAYPGFVTYVHGHELTIWGTLHRTGLKYFDNTLFIPIETLYKIADETKIKENVAPLEIQRNQISVVLVKGEERIRPDVLEVRIEGRVPGVIAIPVESVVHTVKLQVSSLFGSLFILAAVLWIANTLMISAIFSTIVSERQRELGILRAIGANRGAVFKLIILESVVLTSIGGIIGIVCGHAIFLAFKNSITSSFTSLRIPYIWPKHLDVLIISLLSFISAISMGVLGALYPAFNSTKMEPYLAIRAGE
jgi:putative ABC transport system permease protein